jgi:hypothetical protein
MLIGIGVHFAIMVKIDDDVELVLQGLVDGPIDALGKRLVDGEWRIRLGMGRKLDWQPNGIKPGLLDGLKILGLERDTPIALLRRFQGVAEVDAAAKLLVGGEDVGWLVLGIRHCN